jgi:predicted amidohydrolase YtcJ
MAPDFTLRDVVVAAAAPGEPGACDLIFRGGRLADVRHREPAARPRLFATPGFWDAHIHMLHVGLRAQRLDLGACTSLDEALSLLAQFAREHPEPGLIWAENWDDSVWVERRLPTRDELDRIVPDRPVVLRRVCGHLAIVNGRALEEAALHWPDVDPSGVLTEERAMRLASIWPPTPEERARALRGAQERALRMGIVRVAEMGSDGALDAYLDLAKHDALMLEVSLYVKPSQIDLALRLRGEGWLDRGRLRLGGVKLFMDGSIGARTAALRAHYADRAERGRLLYDDAALLEILTRCWDARLPVAVHAIGDAAIDQIVRGLETLVARGLHLDPHWASIEHAELLTTDLLERLAPLGVRLSLQPNFVARWGQPGGLYEQALGPERWAEMNPLRRALSSGVPISFGSDGMPMDPALGLLGAVTHPIEAQRLTITEALEIYYGHRVPPWTHWSPAEYWRLGCDSFVLYEADPQRLADGELGRAPVRAILWHGAWVQPPSDSLKRWGLVHGDGTAA